MDIIEDIVEVPLVVEAPEVIANEQLMIYVPLATNEHAGVSKPGDGLLVQNDEMVIDLDYLDERYSKLEDFDTFKQEIFDEVDIFKTGVSNEINDFKTDVSDEIGEFKDDISTDINSFKEEVVATQRKELERVQKEVDNLYVITGATVTDEYSLSQAYSKRQTADGNADIIDGALTRVTKSQGATVATTNLYDGEQNVEIKSTQYKTIFTGNITGTVYFKCKFTGTHNTPAAKLFSIIQADDTEKVVSGQYVNNVQTVNGVKSITISNWSGTAGTFTNIMISKDKNATYRPYFSGLRNAHFKGIRSTGKNLIKFPYSFTTYEANGITFTAQSDGGIKVKGTATATAVRNLNATPLKGVNAASSNGVVKAQNGFTISGGKDDVTVAINAGDGWAYMYVSGGKTVDTVIYPMFQYGEFETTTYELYQADESFMLDEAVPLGKWDYIDTENKKVVRSTKSITYNSANANSWVVSTPWNGKYSYRVTLPWKASGSSVYNTKHQYRADIKSLYLTGGGATDGFGYLELHSDTISTIEELREYFTNNPLEVAYPVKTPIDGEDLVIPTNKYKAKKGGSETQVQGNTDYSADGANNTVSQDYYTQKGA